MTANPKPLTRDEIESRLREEDPQQLERLFGAADAVRARHVGEAVILRGLVEISSHCKRSCAYCGLRAQNKSAVRYRMENAEIFACAERIAKLGIGTIVLQAGEDPALDRDRVAEVILGIKERTGLAVTLSLGEREDADYEAWRRAGADRYLLRFETSDPELYSRIHPRHTAPFDRFAALHRLRDMGYEIGSGVMVGIPGQTVESLARDIELFFELGLPMIGSGPYVPDPATPLGISPQPEIEDQVPADLISSLKVIALSRILRPDANIPSTTALATIAGENGRARALETGANVLMPNFTPEARRADYAIYPNKAVLCEASDHMLEGLRRDLSDIGRIPR